jgi:pyruvate/2-oxoacid:ferredoxin oxidoreductase beta subunit
MDINVLVLDTQVYSNTGGQASTASYFGQDAKMAATGRDSKGKRERRKELSHICLMHPEVYVAQTTPAHINHFYKAIMEASPLSMPSWRWNHVPFHCSFTIRAREGRSVND